MRTYALNLTANLALVFYSISKLASNVSHALRQSCLNPRPKKKAQKKSTNSNCANQTRLHKEPPNPNIPSAPFFLHGNGYLRVRHDKKGVLRHCGVPLVKRQWSFTFTPQWRRLQNSFLSKLWWANCVSAELPAVYADRWLVRELFQWLVRKRCFEEKGSPCLAWCDFWRCRLSNLQSKWHV